MTRFRFVAVVLLVTVSLARADFVSIGRGTKIERDLPYVPNGDAAQVLDVYLPDRPIDQPLPLIIYIHGGGWSAGSKASVPAAEMVANGYAVASVEYRFSQVAKFPAQIQDCQAALRWLRANANAVHIDPDRIGLFGESAGGHLVALMGTSGGKNAFPAIGVNADQSDRVQAVCDCYGPSDFTSIQDQIAHDKVKNVFHVGHGDPYSQLIGVERINDVAVAQSASPVHFVSRDNPPFLILHGTADTLVPVAQSVELNDALKKAGVDSTLQIIDGAGHGGPAFATPATINLLRSFFAKHLQGADVKVDAFPTTAPATGK